MGFIYNLVLQVASADIEDCFAQLSALIISLVVREGKTRDTAQDICEFLSLNDVFCQKMVEQLSGSAESIMIHLPMTTHQRIKSALDAVKDPPDEFLDPLTYNLMHQPVILPDQLVIDRSTLINLSEGNSPGTKIHPYTQMEFKVKDVKDDEELREKVNNWLGA